MSYFGWIEETIHYSDEEKPYPDLDKFKELYGADCVHVVVPYQCCHLEYEYIIIGISLEGKTLNEMIDTFNVLMSFEEKWISKNPKIFSVN